MARRRIRLIILTWGLTAAVLILQFGGALRTYSPYIYGFLLDPVGGDRPTLVYIERMDLLSPIYTSFADVMQTVLGMQMAWFYLPGAIVIGILVYALVPRDIQDWLRWSIAAAAVMGPVGIIGYYYKFSRDSLDMIFLLTFILLTIIISRDTRNSKPQFSLVFMASMIFWLTHYSFWPLFALTALFLTLSTDGWNLHYTAVALTVPVIIHQIPAQIYISSFAIIWGRGLSLDLLTAFGGAEAIPSQAYLVAPVAPRLPEWLPIGQYVAYGLLLAIFTLLYLWALFRSHGLNIDRLLTADRRVKIAIAAACAIYGGLLVARGYIYRAVILWPLIVLVLSTELHTALDEVDKRPVMLTGLLTITLILAAFAPMMTPFFQPSQNPNDPSVVQQSSTEFTRYTSEECDIYTDLVHGSLLILDGEQSVVVGQAMTAENGSVALDRRLQTLTGNWHEEARYALVTESGSRGVRVWGGTIPPLNEAERHPSHLRVYANGEDAWYARPGFRGQACLS